MKATDVALHPDDNYFAACDKGGTEFCWRQEQNWLQKLISFMRSRAQPIRDCGPCCALLWKGPTNRLQYRKGHYQF